MEYIIRKPQTHSLASISFKEASSMQLEILNILLNRIPLSLGCSNVVNSIIKRQKMTFLLIKIKHLTYMFRQQENWLLHIVEAEE